VTLNAFDVRPTYDTADVQALLPFPPNLPRSTLSLMTCILCNETAHTTFGSTSQEDHDVQIAVGTRVEPPQTNRANSRTHQLSSVGEAAISLEHWFTLFPRDDSSDYRNIPNFTFTVCNRNEFHDLATLPTQVTA
jgi:hypothetical protein